MSKKKNKSIENSKTSTKSSTASSQSKRGVSRFRKIRGTIILTLIIAVVGFAIFFKVIDNFVAKRLSVGDVSEGSKVWSDSEFFRKGQKISLDYLRNLLSQRNYTANLQLKSEALTPDLQKLDSSYLTPGEYNDFGKSLRISTRAFTDFSGKQVKSSDIAVSTEASEDFILEPVSLAHLGNEETRASRFLPIAKTPKHLIDAVLSIEDERFYGHFGVDPIGILRAIYTNIFKGRLAQGGSTITQQLAKNLFFSPHRTFLRKLREIPAALSLEWRLDKQKILEMYLNEVYLGQDGAIAIHGMGEAAHAFFGKNAADLDVAEAATLAGLIQAPSSYAPKRFPNRALKRRNTVLDKMLELHHLESDAWQKAKNSALKLRPNSEYKAKIPFYLSALQENLAEHINLDAAIRDGINVHTGIQSDLQECAESAISHGTKNLEKTYPNLLKHKKPLEAAILAIEPFSGKIRAWVGGRDFQSSQFDRVSKAKRQIGSTVKPFVYLTALDGSLNTYKTATAISVLSDRPMEVETQANKFWNPENYDHEYRGDVTLRYALEHSLNVPAVYISQKFGVRSLANVISQFHVEENPKDLPAIALGAIDTSLLKLTSAYAALANGGIYVAPRLFISAQDFSGSTLQSTNLEEKQVANEAAVFVLTSILEGVVDRGTGTAIRKIGYAGPAAGKTGTTNDARDAWFVGYTPELAVGVWLGFDDNLKVGLTGGVAAAPIWGEFMSCVAKNRSLVDFVPPPSVSLVNINPESGLKVSQTCAGVSSIQEYFVKGTEPQDYCEATKPLIPQALPATEPEQEPSRNRERSLWDNLFG